MVLISHIYKFIYIKNVKVAGSSVESFFGQFCIDPNEKDKYSFEDKQNPQISKFGILGYRVLKYDENMKFSPEEKIWFNHKNAKDIKNDIGDTIFDNYFKFCVIRNPYDFMVSKFFWKKNVHNYNYDFKTFCKNYNEKESNLSRILVDNKMVCQFCIRYENLINDILHVLKLLNIKEFNITKLPHHKKSETKENYRNYYDEESKKIVTEIFKDELEYFQYTF